MSDSGFGREHLLKQIISGYRCDICRRSFDREHVRLAARHEGVWIVSVRCRLCRNQQVFWIAFQSNEEQELLRDVTDSEEEQFAAMAPVTADDVLDVHEFLRDFDGDFDRLFRS